MANFLASIFGTEQDKVNCSFYYKIGACRHGDRCSRKHVKPSYSQTILMPNLYHNPAYDPVKQAAQQQQHRQEQQQQQQQQQQQNQQAGGAPPPRPPPVPAMPPSVAAAGGGAGAAAAGGGPATVMNEQQLQNHFDAFYEDVWCEMCTRYGELEELVVCDNNNDHLVGNVYARFKYEDAAQRACDDLNGRWYAARPVYCELSPVTDFREACCRLNSGEGCIRGGFCNFIHRKNPSPELERELDLATRKWLRSRPRDARSESRSPSPAVDEGRRRRY